jgi:hypothetical protein
MNDHRQGPKHWRKRLWPILILVAFLLLLLFVPPLVSVSRYKSQITSLISQSLGRPVRLSSVELRIFPWPGFEITNLNVAEDPAYGVEPVLHADTVRASIRLLSLWRGRLEIGTISVDQASLNIVHNGPGKWNLDPLFRTAVAKVGSATVASGSRRAVPLPYLEATESRINFKEGAEKLPFSLVNAEFEIWQENPGDWRIRLRGQPARTDLSLYQEDTGVLRLEASMQHASALHLMPVRLDLDWRDAQLGQLLRLVFGSDPGWRGNLTGNLHLEGTGDSAHVITRLRAEGVHRAEFAPAEPLDFDANCDFIYHYPRRGFEKLACSSPLGDGRVSVTGDQPGANAAPRLTAELNHVPVAAGLGLLRTVRSGVAPDLQASGTVSGKIAYDATIPAPVPATKAPRSKHAHPAQAEAGPLAGSLTVDGLTLKGGGLTQPIPAPKIVLEPVVPQSPDQRLALAGTTAVPLGGTVPLTLSVSVTTAGYRAELHGQVSMARARELTQAVGLAQADALDGLAGDPLQVDMAVAGPWLMQEQIPPALAPEPDAGSSETAPRPASLIKVQAPASIPEATPATDIVTGTVTMRNANWRADFLAGHVQIAQATLRFARQELVWDPIEFTYGGLKGTAALFIKTACASGEKCKPGFRMHFNSLDVADLQSAILGVQQKSTLLSSLIGRLHPEASPPWPALEGNLDADSLVLGPVKLAGAFARVRIVPAGAQITALSGSLLGGTLDASGSFIRAANDKDKPGYSFEGKIDKMNAAEVGQLLGQRWLAGLIGASGKVELEGYTEKDLAASAKGTLHFEWGRGAISFGTPVGKNHAELLPVSLTRFDNWSGDAAIAPGAVTLGENLVRLGLHHDSIAGSVKFGDPPEVALTAAKQKIANKPAH